MHPLYNIKYENENSEIFLMQNLQMQMSKAYLEQVIHTWSSIAIMQSILGEYIFFSFGILFRTKCLTTKLPLLLQDRLTLIRHIITTSPSHPLSHLFPLSSRVALVLTTHDSVQAEIANINLLGCRHLQRALTTVSFSHLPFDAEHHPMPVSQFPPLYNMAKNFFLALLEGCCDGGKKHTQKTKNPSMRRRLKCL